MKLNIMARKAISFTSYFHEYPKLSLRTFQFVLTVTITPGSGSENQQGDKSQTFVYIMSVARLVGSETTQYRIYWVATRVQTAVQIGSLKELRGCDTTQQMSISSD